VYWEAMRGFLSGMRKAIGVHDLTNDRAVGRRTVMTLICAVTRTYLRSKRRRAILADFYAPRLDGKWARASQRGAVLRIVWDVFAAARTCS
jgi:hypothetical protein